MSTKSTITYGKDFHLYTDYEDGLTGVWLQLDQPGDFIAAGYSGKTTSVTLRIPLAVWEHLRQHSPADYSLADLTDAQILAKAELEADEDRARYKELLAESKKTKGKSAQRHPLGLAFVRIHGYHRSRAWQIERNLKRLQDQRKQQLALRTAVKQVGNHERRQLARNRRNLKKLTAK
ncbi:MAG: hypothetical protein WC661_17935 [Opitutaceae bacterium]|jgi:hypothetical protein